MNKKVNDIKEKMGNKIKEEERKRNRMEYVKNRLENKRIPLII